MTAVGLYSLAAAAETRAIPPWEGPPIDCALVGVGIRGREILQMLSRMDRARTVAYCDLYEPFLRRGAQVAPEGRAYQDFTAMLAESPEIQAVFVATPTHLHREFVEQALAAGKHVYCEAPMASTLEDCRAMAQAAQKSDRVYAVGLQNRANPVFEHASKFIRARATGSLVTEEGHWFENSSWRRPVSDPDFEDALNWRLDAEVSLGLLGEAGVHSFDNSLRFQQDFPTAVTSFGSLMKWRDGRTTPDTVLCVFEYPGGFLSLFEATLANSFRERYYLLVGSEGTILIEDIRSWWFKEADAPNLGWEVYASREKIGNEEGIVLVADATKLLEQGLLPGEHEADPTDFTQDPLYIALEDFLNSVANRRPPACGYLEGYRSTLMAIQAHQALVKRQRIEIDPAAFEI